MATHQAPPSLGFSKQEHWSGSPFPSPVHESEKWKWSCVWLLAIPWIAAYQARLSMGFSRQEYWSRVPLPSPSQDYYLLHLPAWIRGLELGGTFPGTTFLLPSKTNESAHLEPTGQSPPRTFPVDLQTHFCLGFFMTMVIYLTLTSTLVQLPHLVPKQVLNHSRDKPSQAERGSNLGRVCVPAHSIDIKTKWITPTMKARCWHHLQGLAQIKIVMSVDKTGNWVRRHSMGRS